MNWQISLLFRLLHTVSLDQVASCIYCSFHIYLKGWEFVFLKYVGVLGAIMFDFHIFTAFGYLRGRPKIHFVTDSGIWPLQGEGVYY